MCVLFPVSEVKVNDTCLTESCQIRNKSPSPTLKSKVTFRREAPLAYNARASAVCLGECPGAVVLLSSAWLTERLRKPPGDLRSQHSRPSRALDPTTQHTPTALLQSSPDRNRPVASRAACRAPLPEGLCWATSSSCSETSQSKTQQGSREPAAQVHFLRRGDEAAQHLRPVPKAA